MTTAQEVEEHANRIAMLGMGQSVVLLRQYADLIKTYAEALAENARLKAAMDKYSEDEILLIERCAKVCDSFAEKYAAHAERKGNDSYKALVCNGISAAIRALPTTQAKGGLE
jgi:hypothetical protein